MESLNKIKSSHAKASKRPTLVRQFLHTRRGTSAVEFALVAPLFFAMIFATLEAGYYFFINSAVDAATARASRIIRTGQAQNNSISREAFFGQICDVVKVFGDCDKKLTVEVSNFSTFADLSAANTNPVCRDSDPSIGQPDPANLAFSPGAAREIIQVRVCYLYENITPGIGLKLESASGGAKKIITSSVFRNEPF